MPVTPFHFGPGLVLKGAAAPVFSWSAFAAAQVVIDCETIYYMVSGEYPVHRFFHSFLGAAVAGLVAAVLFLVVVHASFIGFRLSARHRGGHRVSLARHRPPELAGVAASQSKRRLDAGPHRRGHHE